MSIDSHELQLPTVIGAPNGRVLPRSFAVWMTAFYVGLFIIRPWELLIIELGAIKFERTFAIAMIVTVMASRGLNLRFNLQNVAVAVLCAAMAISTLLAWNVEVAWNELYIYLTVVVCYWALISVIQNPYELFFVVGAYIAFMEIYLGKSLWEFFVHDRYVYLQGVIRLIGIGYTFGNFNAVAGSTVISMPFWLFFWRSRREVFSPLSSRWQKWTVRALFVYPILAAVTVVLTQSRQGMVNFGVFLIVFTFQSGRQGNLLKKAIMAAVLLGVAWICLPTDYRDRVRSIWDSSAGSESAEGSKMARVDAVLASIETLRRFPITGVGPGNFMSYRRDYLDGVYLESHNLIGQMLSETGLFGATAFAFLVTAILINCRKVTTIAAAHGDQNLQLLAGLARACRYSLLFLFVEGISQNNFDRFNWLWIGAFSSLAAQYAVQIRAAKQLDET